MTPIDDFIVPTPIDFIECVLIFILANNSTDNTHSILFPSIFSFLSNGMVVVS